MRWLSAVHSKHVLLRHVAYIVARKVCFDTTFISGSLIPMLGNFDSNGGWTAERWIASMCPAHDHMGSSKSFVMWGFPHVFHQEFVATWLVAGYCWQRRPCATSSLSVPARLAWHFCHLSFVYSVLLCVYKFWAS